MRPTPQLRAALESLSDVEGVRVLGEFEWSTTEQRFILPIETRIDQPSRIVPATPKWHVLCHASYPAGKVKIHPSQDGGITATFPHQSYNGDGGGEKAWREGDLCLETPVRRLGRMVEDDEPLTNRGRLRWHVTRARQWLQKAASGSLQVEGEPFELPQWPEAANADPLIGFLEGPQTLATAPPAGAAGHVEFVDVGPGTIAVRSLRDTGKRRIMGWGRKLGEAGASDVRGAWVRVPTPPILEPWQGPATWGQLRGACQAMGVDLHRILEPHLDPLRDGDRHVLLLGFPIPATYGGTPKQLHWAAIRLPQLIEPGAVPRRGFRSRTLMGRNWMDRNETLRDDKPVEWLPTENWSPHEYWLRGGLPEALRAKHYLLLGGGSLGSVLGSTLVRLGACHVHIVDDEELAAPNLVRHDLGLQAVGKNKAEALAARLNDLHPHANATWEARAFSTNATERYASWDEADVIIDCTASEDVIHALARIPWTRPKAFLSLSTSAGYERLYLYASHGDSFDEETFDGLLAPPLSSAKDAEADSQATVAAGCWHAAFPGRHDDLLVLVGRAARRIEAHLLTPPIRPVLEVIARDEPAAPTRPAPAPAAAVPQP